MGYTDKLTLVARSLALTGTGSVSDSVDLGSTVRARDVAAGEPLGFLISVDVAATRTAAPGDDETYTFKIIESATGALGSPTVLSETTIDYATLVAGFQFILPVPIGLISKRYLGLNFVLAGTTPTITVTAGLKPLELADANPRPYASGFAIR